MTQKQHSRAGVGVTEILLSDLDSTKEDAIESVYRLEQTIEDDRPGTSSYRPQELLNDFGRLTSGGWTLVKDSVAKSVNLLFSLIPRYVEEVEAGKARNTLADAQAEVHRANAELVRAHAAEVRAQTKRKDALLRELRKRGIDFATSTQDGILRVCFTKEQFRSPAAPENDSGTVDVAEDCGERKASEE